LTEFHNGYVCYLKSWKIECFERLDSEQADDDKMKKVVAALLLQNNEIVKSLMERKTA
jgi:hypothetical protein